MPKQVPLVPDMVTKLVSNAVMFSVSIYCTLVMNDAQHASHAEPNNHLWWPKVSFQVACGLQGLPCLALIST